MLRVMQVFLYEPLSWEVEHGDACTRLRVLGFQGLGFREDLQLAAGALWV